MADSLRMLVCSEEEPRLEVASISKRAPGQWIVTLRERGEPAIEETEKGEPVEEKEPESEPVIVIRKVVKPIKVKSAARAKSVGSGAQELRRRRGIRRKVLSHG